MENEKISILVVEDEMEMREMISDFLRESEGYTVYDVAGGQEALELLKKEKVDLVLSDINMPGIKGFDLLKIVKDNYPDIKRVLITAYNVEDYMELALKHDIGNIFVKTTPFNFYELSTVLRKLLKNDIFGLKHYFEPSVNIECFEVDSTRTLDIDAEKIVKMIGDDIQSYRLQLVIVELLTNAVFYGVQNESPDNKEAWNHNFVLPKEKMIKVCVAKDSEKYAVSVSDCGGRLQKQDVLYWMNRQISRDRNGLPLGLYDTHGRGLFIARKYIDRLIINIDYSHRTEVIVINYFSDAFKGYKPLYINEI